MCQEFRGVMGNEGPAHTTLLRYANGNVKRRNAVTEQYVQEAIDKVTVEFELVQKKLRKSETQRKRVLKELRQTEIRFHDLVENAKDIILRYRFLPTPGMEYISPSVTDILGYTPEEFYADPALGLKIIHPDDRRKLEEIMRGERFEEPRILRYMHKDGSSIWIERVAVPIYDEAGNLVAMESISRDITERKRMEKALRETEERFRSLVEHTNDILWELDQEGAYTYVSPTVQDILGYSPEHLIGKTPSRSFGQIALNGDNMGEYIQEQRDALRWRSGRKIEWANGAGERESSSTRSSSSVLPWSFSSMRCSFRCVF